MGGQQASGKRPYTIYDRPISEQPAKLYAQLPEAGADCDVVTHLPHGEQRS
jgi:hypothetical protein